MHALLATTTAAAAPKVIPVCSKCGTVKKTGKLSCCARHGAWYENCGEPGDTDFDHTWFEGIAACISKFIVYLTPICGQNRMALTLRVFHQLPLARAFSRYVAIASQFRMYQVRHL